MRGMSKFALLGWLLAAVMWLYLALVIVPTASANVPEERPQARLLLEIKGEQLRIFEYETKWLRCHIAIIDVRVIGSQLSHTCVIKDAPTFKASQPFEVPLR